MGDKLTITQKGREYIKLPKNESSRTASLNKIEKENNSKGYLIGWKLKKEYFNDKIGNFRELSSKLNSSLL